MRKCRFCAKEIGDASTVCEHCGKDLFPGRAAAAVVVAAPTGEHCPSCGGAVARTDRVCPHCQHGLGHAAAAYWDPDLSRAPIARVTVVDVDIKFGTLLMLLLKLGIAAIPAFLILSILGGFVLAVMAVLMIAHR